MELCRQLLLYAAQKKIYNGIIFRTVSGKAVNRSNVWKEMKDLCEGARVNPEKVFPHNLRHLFAQCFYRIGNDIDELAGILGHSSIETTRIYLMRTGKEHRKGLEKMELVLPLPEDIFSKAGGQIPPKFAHKINPAAGDLKEAATGQAISLLHSD